MEHPSLTDYFPPPRILLKPDGRSEIVARTRQFEKDHRSSITFRFSDVPEPYLFVMNKDYLDLEVYFCSLGKMTPIFRRNRLGIDVEWRTHKPNLDRQASSTTYTPLFNYLGDEYNPETLRNFDIVLPDGRFRIIADPEAKTTGAPQVRVRFLANSSDPSAPKPTNGRSVDKVGTLWEVGSVPILPAIAFTGEHGHTRI